MSQKGIRPWVVRAVGPEQQVQYFLLQFNASGPAKERVENWLKNKGKWQIEEPVEPQQI
jgi:hypothetical protein